MFKKISILILLALSVKADPVHSVNSFIKDLQTQGIEGIKFNNKKTVEQKWRICSSCHGEKADIEYYGARQLKDLDVDQITNKLKYYKNKENPNGDLASMMRAQVLDYTDEDIDEMAKHIKALK